ncbi:MAG: N-acetyl-gamma-glutamyl-phosphate reductase [Candidatus Erwinia impunctatus]
MRQRALTPTIVTEKGVSAMLNTLIVGSSGYAGVELASYLNRHPQIHLSALAVSAQSPDAGKLLSDLHPQLKGIVDLPLQPMSNVDDFCRDVDVVFLATAHEVSHDLVPQFLNAGCVVFDLSGAYRVNNPDFYTQYYGFSHQHADWLEKAVYGLAEWQAAGIRTAQLIAVPGCYPTAAQLALKPLIEADVLEASHWPVINATSGVSGAGRKASVTTSFCEVSLQPYGLFTHRHQPEIASHLGIPVIFTPHLGNFPRGILATTICRLKTALSREAVTDIFHRAYHDKPLIRLYQQGVPSIKGVAGLPFCDIGFAIQGEHLIIVSAEDNLLKGASSQAIQCLNIRFGFPETESLI